LGHGLREDWHRIVATLEALIPDYDRGNRIISFGRDYQFRREGVAATVREGDRVLDLGAGPGEMAEVALEDGSPSSLTLLDASLPMLRAAKARLGDRVEVVAGVFEQLPFREGAFDAAIAGFALRDAYNLEAALQEAARVLAPSGRLGIVDLGKPDSRVKRALVGLYWRVLAPLIATLFMGLKGLGYRAIYTTYRRLPTNAELRELLAVEFPDLKVGYRLLEGVVIIRASKARG
jgi:demethylmenaquinone methyltransferase/2-methoxy-6-polyprenyl-1,4-benzoquinol methylase